MSINKISEKQKNDVSLNSGQELANKKAFPDTINLFGSPEGEKKATLTKEAEISLFNNSNLVAENVADESAQILESLKSRYPEKQLCALEGLTTENLKLVKELSKTQLCAAAAADISLRFEENEVKEITNRILEVEKACGKDNVYKITFATDVYDNGAFVIDAMQKDPKARSVLLDNDFKVRAVEELEEYETSDGSRYRERRSSDLKNNTSSKTRYALDDSTKRFYPTHETVFTYDKDGKVVSSTYTRPSKVSGVYDVDKIDANGKVVPLCLSTVDEKTGTVTVKKDMASPDGTRTLYNYSDCPNGDRDLTYRILDKDGNVLMDNKKSFRVVAENHYTSSSNDKNYDIVFGEKSVTVTDMADSKNPVVIDLSKVSGDKGKILKALKQLPGEELIAFDKSVKGLKPVADGEFPNFDAKIRTIYTSEDLFDILHELGHAKDYKNLDVTSLETAKATVLKLVSTNEDLIAVFTGEKIAFNNAFPEAQRKHLDYFLNNITHAGGSTGGIKEVVAEGNALLNSPKQEQIFALRAQYLQQYFPKTIAYIDKLFKNN